MTSTSAEGPVLLTSHNLLRLARGSSLTPTWEPSNASQFLSSGASSSRRPMADRIMYTKRQVRHYMDLLFKIQPEGAQAVLGSGVRRNGKDSVCLQTTSPQRKDYEVLAFWKRKRFYFKEQLFQIRKEGFGTPPVTPTLSELREDCRMSVAGAERGAQLQQTVETWLHHIPPGSYAPPPSILTGSDLFDKGKMIVKPGRTSSRSTLAEPLRRSRRLAQLPLEFRPLAPRGRR